MKYIQADGGIWRLSERKLAQLKRDLIAGKDPRLDDYGPMVVDWFENLDALIEEAGWAREELAS